MIEVEAKKLYRNMPTQNLLFIDTNIWLDFYRARNEAVLELLQRTEEVADRLIVSYQLETEFKKNRQAAILEGLQELKAPQQIAHPGIFSDAKATELIKRNLTDAEKQVRKLRDRLLNALENPAVYDPICKICQRVFHKKDDLTLNRDDAARLIIRRKAFRRFLDGCPPRKKNDTSMGDAFNWEWMIDCAKRRRAGVIIVTRDTDYGVTVDRKSYVNDHLRQEFSKRVSQKRTLKLCSRLSDALKLFSIKVTPEEDASESELVSTAALGIVTGLPRLVSRTGAPRTLLSPDVPCCSRCGAENALPTVAGSDIFLCDQCYGEWMKTRDAMH